MVTLVIYGHRISTTKVRIWKDSAWRAACLVEGHKYEISYPLEFGADFLRRIQDGIFNAHQAMAILRGDIQ